jgi:hypothetical protein
MLYGRVPYSGATVPELLAAIDAAPRGQPPAVPGVSAAATKLLIAALQLVPEARISIVQMATHAFLCSTHAFLDDACVALDGAGAAPGAAPVRAAAAPAMSPALPPVTARAAVPAEATQAEATQAEATSKCTTGSTRSLDAGGLNAGGGPVLGGGGGGGGDGGGDALGETANGFMTVGPPSTLAAGSSFLLEWALTSQPETARVLETAVRALTAEVRHLELELTRRLEHEQQRAAVTAEAVVMVTAAALAVVAEEVAPGRASRRVHHLQIKAAVAVGRLVKKMVSLEVAVRLVL